MRAVRTQFAELAAQTIPSAVNRLNRRPFSVWARFEGSDSFTLDRQLGDDRDLFGVIWGKGP